MVHDNRQRRKRHYKKNNEESFFENDKRAKNSNKKNILNYFSKRRMISGVSRKINIKYLTTLFKIKYIVFKEYGCFSGTFIADN